MTKNTLTWLIPSAILVAGTTAVFWYLNKKPATTTPATAPVKTTTPKTAPAGCTYPLKFGSNNSCVKQLQQALINAFGSEILPVYGADGNFGNETLQALTIQTNKTQITDAADLQNTIASFIF